MKLAICPGSFDPVTKGHIDIISRASKLFDRVIVLVSVNPKKQNTFSVEKRCEFIKKAVGDNPKIEVDCCDGLIAEYAKKVGANAIVTASVSEYVSLKSVAKDVEIISLEDLILGE